MTFNYSNFTETEEPDNLIAQINRAVIELREAELNVREKEEELREANNIKRNLSENVIPQLMEEAEVEQLITKDGLKVVVKEVIRASISVSNKPEAFAWLKENGQDSLIKRQFIIEFDRDEQEWAAEFEKQIRETQSQLNVKRKDNVHSSTLAAFIREQLGEGVDIPLNLFGVHKQKHTKIG